MIKACIFDLDGTLLDTLSGITYYINQQFKGEGLCPVTGEETAEFLGHGATNLITSALASRGVTDGDSIARVLSAYKASYDENPTYLVEPYRGIHELIDSLISMGIRIAVLSNKPDFATRQIIKHYFGDKIEWVRGAVDGVPLKPEPDSLFALMRMIGIDADECVFIGDSEYDVLTGKNAGVKMIAVSWGFRSAKQLRAAGAERIINTPSELIEAIGYSISNG